MRAEVILDQLNLSNPRHRKEPSQDQNCPATSSLNCRINAYYVKRQALGWFVTHCCGGNSYLRINSPLGDGHAPLLPHRESWLKSPISTGRQGSRVQDKQQRIPGLVLRTRNCLQSKSTEHPIGKRHHREFKRNMVTSHVGIYSYPGAKTTG